MSNVTLKIGGREYTVACADGEEAHVTGLGTLIDDKLTDMPNALAHSETRSLLFAALLLADEVFERRAQAAASAPAPDPALAGRLPDPALAGHLPDPALAGHLDAIAARIERLAALAQAPLAPPLALGPDSA